MDTETLINKLRDALLRRLVVTVTGTGVSVTACQDQAVEGLQVSRWTGLILHGIKHCREIGAASEEVAKQLQSRLAVGDVTSLITVAEQITQILKGRSPGVFRGWLKDTIGALRSSNGEIIEILDRIPGILATLNYDSLIEQATGRRSITWRNAEGTANLLRGDLPPSVLHLHGLWEEPDSVVLGISSYEAVKGDAHIQAVLRHFAVSKTLLFVGCGATFSDPNFSSLLEWAGAALHDVTPRHFLLCRSSELEKLQQDLKIAPWLQLLPYGEQHSDLVPFLKKLIEGTTIVGASSDGGFEGPIQRPRSSSLHLTADFLDEFGAAQSDKLDTIRKRMREGHEASAEEELRAMKASSAWSFLPAAVQSRALRTLAILILNRREDKEEAALLIKEAKQVDPSGRFVVAEALLVQAAEGAEKALPLMAEPANREEWHTRAVLFLNANKIEEARLLLESPSFEPDAETYRLLTHVYLLKDEILNARKSSDSALSLGSEQHQVRMVAGIVDYRSALSPSFRNWTNWLWPFPPAWRYVKCDLGSREMLQRAADRFEEIAKSEIQHSTHWLWAKTWQLAATANIPDAHSAAQAIANELLSSDPAWVPAIAWAAERGLDFPHGPSLSKLEGICQGTPDLEHVQALYSLLTTTGNHEAALTLIEQQKSVFDRDELHDVYLAFQAQAFLLKGDVERAEEVVSGISGEAITEAKGAIVRYRGDHDGWTPELAAQLADEFERTGSDVSLFDACIAHHRAGVSAFVVKHADELMRRFGTEPALRLAIEATSAAADYSLCERLMEQYRAVFQNGDFPLEVKRLHAICLRKQGRLLEAEQELQLLVKSDPTLEDQLLLFGLQLDIGQVAKATVTATTILQDPEATSGMLLHVAGKLSSENPNFAKAAFDQVMRRGLQSPQEAAFAMNLGFTLGLDDQVTGVLKEAIASAGTPGSPMIGLTMEELLEHQREWQNNRSTIEQDYRNGRIAVHAYSQSLREPLALFFHIAPSEIETSEAVPARRWSLRARHGSKRRPKSLGATKNFSIFLDITSILLAAHLNLLEKIIGEFSSVEVSPSVVASLGNQLEKLTSAQPSRIPPKEEVLRLCDDRKISLLESAELSPAANSRIAELLGEEWAKLFEFAERTGAILVDFFPLTSNDAKMIPVTLDSDALIRVRSSGDILEAVEATGDLTATQIELAKERLGEVGKIQTTTLDFSKCSSIILETGIAEQLASAGLLTRVASKVRVLLRSDEVNQMRLELAGAREREGHTEWIRTLKDQVAGYLATGKLRLAPNPEAAGKAAEELDSPIIKCLHDLLNEGRAKDTLSCCDDRLIGRFETIGKSPIVGMFDILWLLHRRKRLPEDELFQILHRLRAGNVRYIPLSAREIVFHLTRARVAGGELIENAELATIRRYVAACLLDSDSFQSFPPGTPEIEKLTENLFLSGLYLAASEAIGILWKDKSLKEESRRAGSDWILDALWIDVASIFALSTQNKLPSNPELHGMSESHLLFLSGDFGKESKSFIEWVFSRWGLDGARTVGFASRFKKDLIEFATKGKPGEEAARQSIAARLLQNLPRSISEALEFTPAELKLVNLKRFDPVCLGEISFDGKTLWPAARLAQKGKPQTIKSEQPSGSQFSLSFLNDGNKSLAFAPLGGGKGFKTSIPGIHGLLSDDSETRYKSMMMLRRRFDQSSKQADLHFRRISKARRVDLRVREALSLLDRSETNQIQGLLTQIREENQIDLAAAEPHGIASILNHLRLPPTIGTNELPGLFNDGISLLVQDEGFEEAFARAATLPISMPQAIYSSFEELGPEAQQKFTSHLDLNETSLLLKFQGALLLLRGGDADQNQGLALLSKLFQPELADRWLLLQAILAWTIQKLRLREKRELIRSTSLIAATWIHSARLFQLLSVGDNPAQLIKLFRGNTPTLGARMFDMDEEGSADVSHPRAFNFLRFLVSGISASLVGAQLGEAARLELLALLEKSCFSTDSLIFLIKQRLGAKNSLGSFLGDISFEANFAGNPAASLDQISKTAVESQVSEYLDLIHENPSRAEAWIGLAAYLSADAAPGVHFERLSDALLKLDFGSFTDPTFEQLRMIASFSFRQMGCSAKGTFEDWLLKLHQLAKILQDPARDYPKRESSHLLANCALWSCDSAGAGVASARAFADAIAQISRNHPAHADILLKSLSWVAMQQPTQYHAAMWPSIVEIRALARRMENFRLND
ncbi:SIR2 family protein [Haloferula sp. BvORR071]|uniref:SIR2 family NAD-dependent protein deacylase n=1 Tax=Haloferula sp. BvORR071 TaxID=1396141 RepID=UPI0005563672|nr:SIR2 family protein [Haloferula sp. BvORR071]